MVNINFHMSGRRDFVVYERTSFYYRWVMRTTRDSVMTNNWCIRRGIQRAAAYLFLLSAIFTSFPCAPLNPQRSPLRLKVALQPVYPLAVPSCVFGDGYWCPSSAFVSPWAWQVRKHLFLRHLQLKLVFLAYSCHGTFGAEQAK